MPSPRPASFRDILSAIMAQLSSHTGIGSNRVLVAQRAEVPHIQGDKDLVLVVGKPQPEEGFTIGGGRTSPLLRRAVQVTPRVRWACDEGDRDDLALLDADNGLLALEELVVDALHVWVPTSSDDWLTQQPIHWLPSEAPVRETPVSHSWVHSDLVFLCRYLLPLTNNGY